jgi:hypothetical protein
LLQAFTAIDQVLVHLGDLVESLVEHVFKDLVRSDPGRLGDLLNLAHLAQRQFKRMGKRFRT